MDPGQSMMFSAFWHFYQILRVIIFLSSKLSIYDQVVALVTNVQVLIMFFASLSIVVKYEEQIRASNQD